MRENDEITGLFRRRLEGMEMDVRDGFWEDLQNDLLKAQTVSGKKTIPFSPRFYRTVAAASVVFVLGVASAAFWYFSPKEEIEQAFTEVATLAPKGSLDGDIVQETFPPVRQMASGSQNTSPLRQASATPAAVAEEDENENVSVRVSITITQRLYGNRQSQGGGHYAQAGGLHYKPLSGKSSEQKENSSVSISEEKDNKTEDVHAPVRNWALKASLGTSLPKGDFAAPLTAGVSVERRLNKYLSLEVGLQYNYLPVGKSVGNDLQALAVPLRLNVALATFPKVALYVVVGGSAEKIVNKGFSEDPVRLSAVAGLGVGYKLNERLSLFAEPLLSHHFATDSKVRSLRSERATNMNLLCGVRMTY